MWNSMYAAFGGCLVGVGIGFRLSRLLKPGERHVVNSTDAATEREKATEQTRQMDSWMGSFEIVTAQVQAQVGQHSVCIDQITTTLEEHSDQETSAVSSAGKQLITANKQLQSELADAKQEIETQRERLQSYARESRTDPLTSLANRRAFEIELGRAFSDFRRTQTVFCLAMLDIDNFKRINDQHGHMVGDQMLKHFARRVGLALRESDFVARFGGEEFVIIMPQTRLEEAVRITERIRSSIEGHPHVVGDLHLQLTASFGIKEVDPVEIASELIQRTDVALYAAKKGGRNCCYVFDGDGARLVQAENTVEPQSAEISTSATF